MLSATFIAAGLIALASAADDPYVGETGWGRLETTWGLNIFAAFYEIPLTFSEAAKDGWQTVFTCSDTDSPGIVLVPEDKDLSALPIYNADGNIAGIILGMDNPGASSLAMGFPFTQYKAGKSLSGKTFYGIAAYYRDPTTICDAGTTGDVEIGDRLWIKNGNGNDEWYKAPLKEDEDLLNSQGYNKGRCFFQMGTHYWRYMSVDMDGDDSDPIFLLYSGGDLVAWGIAMSHTDTPYLDTKRWEHPKGGQTNLFFSDGDWPNYLQTSMADTPLTTIHVYMTNPAWIWCSPF